ncbi:hypothetical protein ONS96_005600 [Cadophora gregata f. sp. sojae]|nr:hypothetical protein ONS96_005600 [Cadophora gregata f. sp. sojae]
MASTYQHGSPGFSPNYSPYNSYQSTGQWEASPSPQYQQHFPGRPLSGRPPSKTSLQPLIHDYGPTPPYLNPPPSGFSRLMIFCYDWWLCILSILVSVVSIAIIAILLFLINNRTIPTLPLNIALNTYISFFATISKASMIFASAESISQLKWLWFQKPRNLHDIEIFDDASRGPMGALRLVFKMRARRLAAIGGAVTVLSIVMEPFTQQVVAYRQREVVSGTARVGKALAYDAGLSLDTLGSGLLIGPEWGMKAAIYDGIFTPEKVQDLVPICSSGNCTFQPFDSLAFCSKCLDVSQNVLINNPPAYPDDLTGTQQISYTIPGGGIVGFSALFEEGNLVKGPAFVSTSVLPEDLPKQVLNIQNPLLALAILQFPHVRQRIEDGNYFSSLPVTHECALYVCVNTYNVSVTNGKANTTVLSSWTSDTGTPTVGAALVGMDGTPDAVLDPSDEYSESNNTYRIPAGSLANLKTWLNVSMQGSMNTSFSKVDRTQWVNDDIQALNKTTDWSFLMNALAKAMTAHIRNSGNPDAVSEVEGVAYQNETYVHVQWVWLVLPAGLVATSTLFLCATMLKSKKKSALAWKSSSLALLFHGLDGVGAGTGEGLKEMKAVARKTRVILSRGEDGEWRLVNTG